MQLFSADTKMFWKKIWKKILPTKIWKNHPQKLLRIPQIHFFPLLPAQPKWPKQKNSCSKMWPIDQLYIELGSGPKNIWIIGEIRVKKFLDPTMSSFSFWLLVLSQGKDKTKVYAKFLNLRCTYVDEILYSVSTSIFIGKYIRK